MFRGLGLKWRGGDLNRSPMWNAGTASSGCPCCITTPAPLLLLSPFPRAPQEQKPHLTPNSPSSFLLPFYELFLDFFSPPSQKSWGKPAVHPRQLRGQSSPLFSFCTFIIHAFVHRAPHRTVRAARGKCLGRPQHMTSKLTGRKQCLNPTSAREEATGRVGHRQCKDPEAGAGLLGCWAPGGEASLPPSGPWRTTPNVRVTAGSPAFLPTRHAGCPVAQLAGHPRDQTSSGGSSDLGSLLLPLGRWAKGGFGAKPPAQGPAELSLTPKPVCR